MTNNNIDRAISQIDIHDSYIGIYEDILEWSEEDKMKIVFSEDEKEFTQNGRSGEDFDEEYIAYCQGELKRHRHELEKAKGN